MSDWWAARLGGGQPPSSTPSFTSGPPPQQPGQWVPSSAQGVATAGPAAPGFKVTVHNLLESVSSWRGGEGARNSAYCPGCGGGNLFRRRNGALEAAPLCYDCGWNGLWTQVQPRT